MRGEVHHPRTVREWVLRSAQRYRRIGVLPRLVLSLGRLGPLGHHEYGTPERLWLYGVGLLVER